jgi:hypothetical protein
MASAISTPEGEGRLGLPDLAKIQAELGKKGGRGELIGWRYALWRFGISPPDLYSPILREQEPAQLGATAAIVLHFLSQGSDSSRPIVAGAGQFHHHIGTERRKAAALLRRESLPALLEHKGSIGAEHGAIGEAKARGAVKDRDRRTATTHRLP